MKKSREQLKMELMGKLEAGLDKVMDWQEAHPKFTLTELEEFVLGLREEMGEEIAEAVLRQMKSKQSAEVLSLPRINGQSKCLRCANVQSPPG